MKIKSTWVSFGVMVLWAASMQPVLAAPFKGHADDSELGSGPSFFIQAPSTRILTPEVVIRDTGADALSVRVVVAPSSAQYPVEMGIAELPLTLRDSATAKPVEGRTDAQGRALFNACSGQNVKLEAVLKSNYYSITDGSQPYQVQATLPCHGTVDLVFAKGSPGSEALGIWRIATLAKTKLAASVGLGFWKSSVGFTWPADADYYNFGQVHITKGEQWDVVGHELGHAIYDLGDLGQFGGGQHKIDECYSTEMALSEGWASYFSAWLSVDMANPDAKFEYMVPRRAPIQFENIPSDVCRSERNEWRVTGYFWDLIDLHADGETSQETFARVWRAMESRKPASMTEAVRLLKAAGFDAQVLDALWTQDL